MPTLSNYYYGSGTINDQLRDFQIAEEGSDLVIQDEANSEQYRFVAGSGLDLPSNRGLLVGGTQVVGSQGSSLTAQDTSTVDATYGTAEAGVISNNRTRIAELESRLQSHGLIQ